jgi:hypothetical protein
MSLFITSATTFRKHNGLGLSFPKVQRSLRSVMDMVYYILNTANWLFYYRWEDLVEKPAEGQWTYFMRNTGTPTTQKPPQK